MSMNAPALVHFATTASYSRRSPISICFARKRNFFISVSARSASSAACSRSLQCFAAADRYCGRSFGDFPDRIAASCLWTVRSGYLRMGEVKCV